MDQVARVPVPVATRAPGGETNAYVVGSDPALLVDPAARNDILDDAVADREVEHVALTHTHGDHVGAVRTYASEHDATVWAHANHVPRFEAATDCTPDRTFTDGDALPAGGVSVSVLETPGHAIDHVAFVVDGSRRVALAGDLVVAEGSVFVGATEGDMRAYLTALRRLRATDPDRIAPGHGPLIDEPEATIDRLYQHRLARERRVLDAVRSGADTIDEVLDAAYDKDLTGVRDLAADTVAAHLEKLAAEGTIVWDGERVVPTGKEYSRR